MKVRMLEQVSIHVNHVNKFTFMMKFCRARLLLHLDEDSQT